MATLRLLLGDQLSKSVSALRDIDYSSDTVLMAEVDAEATYVQHHKQKIVLVFAAMRHFAAEMAQNGADVRYVAIDDPDNTHSLQTEVQRTLEAFPAIDRVVVTHPGEYRLAAQMQGWEDILGVPVDILEDDRFICSLDEFNHWADGKKTLTMEYFYREMRKKTGLLMEDGAPVGEKWNFDKDNRKKMPKGHRPKARISYPPDQTTKDVIQLVETRYADHFGEVDKFRYATNRAGALQELESFVDDHLPMFGDYQDAMATGEDFAHHSLLAAYINIGLLDPVEVCEATVAAYEDGRVPINAAEGFVRQILGWREFIRGIYWRFMPEYASRNALNAERPLPTFYWTGDTDLYCMAEAVRTTKENAYAHHIQRLMVTGNFALLAGIAPAAINEWYLLVYADAYDWVQLPNTHGMAIWADGGTVGSKPYAASGAYINRMSDYCKSCRYDVKEKTGPNACPFNYLYWDFMIRHEDRFRKNQRMSMVMRNLDKKSDQERDDIKRSAAAFLDGLNTP